MEKPSLMSIKRESIRAIFKSVAENDSTSRAEISRETGLSLMTVGKVIDALLEMNVVHQVKEKKNAAGRKAGLISLQNDRFMIVLDLTSNNFSMSVTDIKLHIIDKMVYSYNDNFYFEENLYIFLKNVKMYIGRCFDMTKCIGCGFTVPGQYDSESDTVINSRIAELNQIKILTIAKDILKFDISVIEEDIKSAAISNINTIKSNENITVSYIRIGEVSVNEVTIINGNMLYGDHRRAGNIGKMLISGGNTYESVVKSIDNEDDFIYATSIALNNLSSLFDPSVIIIESEKRKIAQSSLDKIKVLMTKYANNENHPLPDIILSDENTKHSHRGIAWQLREKWLENIIK